MITGLKWKVRELAEAQGITEAKALGFKAQIYPPSIIPIWEGRAKQVQLPTLIKLCNTLGVAVGDLFVVEQTAGPVEPAEVEAAA